MSNEAADKLADQRILRHIMICGIVTFAVAALIATMANSIG